MPATDIWPVLWPVIIGGVLALLPGAVAQVITHFLALGAARKVEKRLRFEKMTQALWRFESWVDGQRRVEAFGPKLEGDHPNPFPDAMTIAIMDFPLVVGKLDEINSAFLTYSQWYVGAGLRRLKGEISSIMRDLTPPISRFTLRQ